MSAPEHNHVPAVRPHCCPCCDHLETGDDGISRRRFLSGAALGGVALTGLSWSVLSAAEAEEESAPKRRPLVVKPIFTYRTYSRRPQRSWRSWGGIENQQRADEELVRIQGELKKLKETADFPIEFLPVAAIRGGGDLAKVDDIDKADTLLVYAANGDLNAIAKLKKDTIFFCRYKSGPVYLWYEIISPRFLRQHSDKLAFEDLDFGDVVIDDQDEILWRLRSLCGLRNATGSGIVAVGGPSGWSCRQAPDLAREQFKLDIHTVTYKDLGELIKAAMADEAAVKRAKQRADKYLKLPNTPLETKRSFVDNAFLLDQIFRNLMKKANCGALTINGCMATIMPMSQTTACLPLSTLNDDGYLAFCESDFVVIPSGILLAHISGKPVFLQDPTYPHDGIITLAHCTAPRKMDGKTLEPARIVTHFESDYGAAPKVDMHKGQQVTMIAPDFKAERWMGLLGVIEDHPFHPICRSQIDVRYEADDDVVAERMPGFHWMLAYGDYRRELAYALRRTPIEWDYLG